MSLTLNRKVLVLNKLWTAIGVVSLKRAIGLLFGCHADGEPKARIIDTSQAFATFTWEDWSKIKPKSGEDIIRGVGKDFKIPEVVLLTKYDKLPCQRVHFSRRTLYRRDGNQCQYCGDRPGIEELSIDHILPRSQGGVSSWENCAIACMDCNTKKANRTPEQAGMKLLKKPTKPKLNWFKSDGFIPKSWSEFISEAFWNVSLES